MATIVIPCEPRVLVNGTRIAQNLLDSVAASSRPDHEVWLLLPYRAKAAAEPMLDLLRNQFRDLRTLELLTPVTDPYKLVTHMFARLHQALTYENNLNERPIIWVSERGNETFLPGAIDALDAAFFRKKCDTVAGKYFTIPATETSAESFTLDGTFVMSSQLAKIYSQRVPYVSVSSHFRLFLDKVLTEKCYNVANWDELIQVGPVPTTDGFVLPQESEQSYVTSPVEVSIAKFSEETVKILGQSEQIGGPVKAREDLSEAEGLKPFTRIVVPKATKPKSKKAAKEDAVTSDTIKPEEDPESEFI